MRGAYSGVLAALMACLVAGACAVAAPTVGYAQTDTTQVLRDSRGRPIGSITVRPDGRQQARDYRGHPVGSYDPRSNRTLDERGRTVGSGNLLPSLIMNSPRVLERDGRSSSNPPAVELHDLYQRRQTYIDPRDEQEMLLTAEDRDLAMEAMQRAARTSGQSSQEWINSRSDNKGKFEFEPGEFNHFYLGSQHRCRRATMTVQTRDGVVDVHGQVICFVEVRGRWAIVEAWRL